MPVAQRGGGGRRTRRRGGSAKATAQAAHLAVLLIEHGITPAAAAREAGLPNANALYNFFNGRSQSLSIETYESLARVLGTNVDVLRGKDPTSVARNAWRPNADEILVALPASVVAGAREAGVDVPATCIAALREADAASRRRRWQEENRAAIAAWNEFTEREGLPLEHYRTF